MNVGVEGTPEFRDWVRQLLADMGSPGTAQNLHFAPQLTSDLERADCLVVSDDSPVGDDCSLPVIRVFNALEDVDAANEKASGERDRGGARAALQRLEMVRGPREVFEFRQLLTVAWTARHLQCLHRIVGGPLHHEVRGALSVVSLVRQLLEAGGDGASVSGKLRKVGGKVEASLDDLQSRLSCLLGTWPPLSKTGSVDVGALEQWFDDAHSGRQLSMSSDSRRVLGSAPHWVTPVLGGMLDAAARLSKGTVTISARPAETGGKLHLGVSADEPRLSGDQLDALKCPEHWPLASPDLIPYRLGTASLLMRCAGGALTADHEEQRLSFDSRLP